MTEFSYCKIKRNYLVLLVGLLLSCIVSLNAGLASALTISASRDYSANSVVNGGALSVDELQSAYNNNSNVRTIFRSFGISASDIADMDTTAVAGTVTRGGRVIVNGDTVARSAVTAGMQNISNDSGASVSKSVNGVTFYTRRPSVSFAQSSIPAFVVMKNGQFDFAVLAPCGNPVKATPTTQPNTSSTTKKNTKTVTHTVVVVPSPTPAPTPAPTPVAVTAPPTRTVVVSPPTPVYVTSPPPAPVVVPTPTPAPVVQELPKTGGPEDTAGMGAFIALLGGTGHYIFRRSKFRV
jgi:hypothetical protein